MTASQLEALRAQLDAARAELNEAQRIGALLDAADEEFLAERDAVVIARGIIERELASRRVEAWTAVLDRLRGEARRLGLFA